MTRRQALMALVGVSGLLGSRALSAQTQPKFFVIGAVKSPGSFTYEEDLTVRDAIAMAGGLTDWGSARRVRISRVVDGQVADIDVTLSDLVEPNDTVSVPRRFYD